MPETTSSVFCQGNQLCPSNLVPPTFYKIPYCLSPNSIFSFYSASVAWFHRVLPLQQLIVTARSTFHSIFDTFSVSFASKGPGGRKPFVVNYSTLPVVVDWTLHAAFTQLRNFIGDKEHLPRLPLAAFLYVGLPFPFA